jgi:peptidyl-prolyl cis-trans isomerase C
MSLALAVMLPGLAWSQTPPVSQTAGMPLPEPQAGAAWSESLDELERPRDTIVAEVGPRVITRGDVVDAIRSMPPIVSAVPFAQLFQDTTQLLMQRQALVLSAESEALDKDPVVERRMRNAADEALANEMLRRSIAAKVTEKSLHDLYDRVVAGKAGPDTVRARIIMVDQPEQALKLIARLHDNADFADLAREFSQDGTARAGGDLGFVRLDSLAPELGSVIFALAPGQMTEFPVRGGNHWFIIRVEGRGQQLAPNFAEARDALEQDVMHAAAPELGRMALQNTAAKYYGVIGKPGSAQVASQIEKPAARSSN